MSTIRVVNIQHSDATEPNIVLNADGTTVFASGITISGGTNLTVSGTAEFASGTVSAPGITFIDDNNTGIYEPAADTVAITTAATERLRIDSSGRLLVGTNTYTGNGQVAIAGNSSGSSAAGILDIRPTLSRPTAANTTLSLIRFGGADHSNNTGYASINMASDGASSSEADLPGRLEFHTTSDGASAPTERMRIDSIGNVGIGNTAPGAKLQIEGTSDQLKLTYTSIASYIHEVHSNGDYSVSKDSSERMRIDSSGTLTVGPQYDRLNVNPGSGSYDGDPTSVLIDGRTNDGNATAFKIDRFDGSGNASTKFFVNYAGNVGIGTTSPAGKLTLKTTNSNGAPVAWDNSYFVISEGDTSTSFGLGLSLDTTNNEAQISSLTPNTQWDPINYRASQHKFFVTDASYNEAMRIDSSGRLLIGTSSSLPADSQLQVEGTGYYEGGASLRRNSNDTGGTALRICKSRGTSNGSFNPVVSGDTLGIVQFNGADGNSDEIGSEIRGEVDGSVGNGNMPGRLVFSTNSGAQNAAPTERMRIDDEGIIYHNSSNHGIGTFLTQSAGTVKYAFRGHYGSSAGSYSGSISFTVWSNGNVENTNNSYGAISDIKLKENIVDANSQWNDLKALQVRNYNFKEGQTHTQIGLVAQEAELISPGLVYESPDRDAEGNDLGTVTKSVNYSVLYMKAVKALQEAMERIETLETKVAALEAS